MKEGASIRGLNTAATLWCSAAVGACAGAGEILDAVFVTGILVTINLALRPLSKWIDRRSQAATSGGVIYRLTIACRRDQEQMVSALLMSSLAARPLTLRQLKTQENDESDETVIEAFVESAVRDKSGIAKMVDELKLNQYVTTVDWAETTFETD
jgi:putative Mg2+ transporter-C (MgtC) family protein